VNHIHCKRNVTDKILHDLGDDGGDDNVDDDDNKIVE